MKYSFIIPVYNRPDEVADLLASLCEQTDKGFEVVIVEDGSTIPCLTLESDSDGVQKAKGYPSLRLQYYQHPALHALCRSLHQAYPTPCAR